MARDCGEQKQREQPLQARYVSRQVSAASDSTDVGSSCGFDSDGEDSAWHSVSDSSDLECARSLLDAGSQLASPRPQAPTSEVGTTCRQTEEVEEEVVMIFDWDDTLMPSSHITNAWREAAPAPESPCWRSLRRHACIVAATLRAARAAGRVAIVTLAQGGWVHHSAAKFLPGLDLPRLLEELDIPIYYAFDHVPSSMATLARSSAGVRHMLREGVDILERCKRSAMQKCLRRICRHRRQLRLNVVSVGDSTVEKNALKAVLWSPTASRLPAGTHPCKTVKLAEAPRLEHLSEQLRLLVASLPEIVAQREDFDFTTTLNSR